MKQTNDDIEDRARVRVILKSIFRNVLFVPPSLLFFAFLPFFLLCEAKAKRTNKKAKINETETRLNCFIFVSKVDKNCLQKIIFLSPTVIKSRRHVKIVFLVGTHF